MKPDEEPKDTRPTIEDSFRAGQRLGAEDEVLEDDLDIESEWDEMNDEISDGDIALLDQNPSLITPEIVERMKWQNERRLAEIAPIAAEKVKREIQEREDERVEKFVQRCGAAFVVAGSTLAGARAFARTHPDIERPHANHILNWIESLR